MELSEGAAAKLSKLADLLDKIEHELDTPESLLRLVAPKYAKAIDKLQARLDHYEQVIRSIVGGASFDRLVEEGRIPGKTYEAPENKPDGNFE